NADRVVARAVEGALERGGRHHRRDAARAAADRTRLLSASDTRAERPWRVDCGALWRAYARFYVHRTRDRFGALFNALCRPADPQCLRGLRRPSTRGRSYAQSFAMGCFLVRRRAARAAGISDWRHTRFRAHARGVW